MCGLFGLLRCPDAAHPDHASAAFVLLGVLAEERGTDAAGVALLRRRPGAGAAPQGCARYADVRFGGVRIVRARGRFSALWRPALDDDLDRAALAIGHTRWATQGGRGLAAASPLVAGTLVGTHNGDVDAAALRRRFGLAQGPGGTDSEAIYQALARSGGTKAQVKALAVLTGRAALAWADRAQPGRVFLARAALSPLTVGIDAESNLWWASNPQWLRVAESETGIRFTRMMLVAEGTYAVLAAGRPPRMLALRRFTPAARPGDLRSPGVWRGFTAADLARAHEPVMIRHQVARRLGRWPAGAGRGAA
jgi:glucosamine 6-phosphate synthetase-like amidotransferase/phosphosugar isomerase protein